MSNRPSSSHHARPYRRAQFVSTCGIEPECDFTSGDLLLARVDVSPQRFYSLSSQIQREREAYHYILQRTQKQSLDVPQSAFQTINL